MTSNDLKTTTKSKKKNKNFLKAGSKHANNENNDQNLDENLDNNDIKMNLGMQIIYLGMQIISADKTVRNDSIQDLKDFNLKCLSTQAKKGEQLVSMMPAIKKSFNLLCDDRVELHTENESFKNKYGSYDEKWLEESKTRLLQQIDNEKRANLIMSRMKKQMYKI